MDLCQIWALFCSDLHVEAPEWEGRAVYEAGGGGGDFQEDTLNRDVSGVCELT